MGSKTFNHLIEEKFFNQIFEESATFIDDETDSIDLRLRTVTDPEKYVLNDIHLKYSFDPDLTAIDFNLIVEADIEVYERTRHYDEQELASQWFLFECYVNLKQINETFTIKSIRPYSKEINYKKSKFDSMLVPIINREKFEEFANCILKTYSP